MNSKIYSNLKVAAAALSLTLTEMKSTVQRLRDLKLLSQSGVGTYDVERSTNVGNAAPSEAIHSFHNQILQKAIVAVDQQPITERFASSTFVGIPADKIPIIIDQLKSLAHQVLEAHLLNSTAGRYEGRLLPASKSTESDRLYCLSIQFFNLLNRS